MRGAIPSFHHIPSFLILIYSLIHLTVLVNRLVIMDEFNNFLTCTVTENNSTNFVPR